MHITSKGPVVIGALLDAWSVVMPVECAGCGQRDRALCSRCRLALSTSLFSQRLADTTVVVAALRYEGPVRQTILSLKENGRTDVVAALAAPLADAVAAALHSWGIAGESLQGEDDKPVQDRPVQDKPVQNGPAQDGLIQIVLVPGNRTSYRRRGYDPLRLLARRAGLRTVRSALVNVRERAVQKNLALEERSDNLVGSMIARRNFEGARVLILDDVVTTGATILEAARALRLAGAEVIGAVAVAYTPRHTVMG